ncbi:MAG: 4Fe-4S dicluster domain-containing protein [Chloroflexi bacterium]|nr:4Fe-4S dicluster domain-containing protein [Chloroflexota bacterium]MCL5075611.1 4Fe-4S dicluster domain-containing protein [Chloroflexota bacterium]
MTNIPETTALGTLDTEEPRRDFLVKFASGVFAGLVAPAVLGGVTPVQAKPPAQAPDLVPLPDLPPAVAGEDPILRMMQDLRRALLKPVNQRRWSMAIDLRKCVGCQGCAIACVTENKLPPGIVYRPVMTETRGTYPNVSRRFIPRPCMQCKNPPCTDVCPVNATYKRVDGIIVIDYERCIGCRYCLTACPYSARTFDAGYFYSDFEGGDPQPYEKVAAQEYKTPRVRTRHASPVGNARKCHFCIHRIERGELPACVLSCMGRATFFGDANDAQSLVSSLIGQPNVMRLKEELGTEPKLYYLV